jgi:hypothetical protein
MPSNPTLNLTDLRHDKIYRISRYSALNFTLAFGIFSKRFFKFGFKKMPRQAGKGYLKLPERSTNAYETPAMPMSRS